MVVKHFMKLIGSRWMLLEYDLPVFSTQCEEVFVAGVEENKADEAQRRCGLDECVQVLRVYVEYMHLLGEQKQC